MLRRTRVGVRDWNNMWENLHRILVRLLQRSQLRAEERRAEEERARFWAELREGEREAEARSSP